MSKITKLLLCILLIVSILSIKLDGNGDLLFITIGLLLMEKIAPDIKENDEE